MRFCGWPRGGRFGFPRGREGILEKLLPMASGPRGFGTRGGQTRLGRSGGTECQCVCARAPGRAPPGEDPGGAAAEGGRAAPLLPLSGLCGPPRVLPAARVLELAGYLPAIARGGDGGGGRGRAPRSGPAAPFLRLALGFRLAVGGAVAPARSSGAIESVLLARALSGSACPAAQRLGCRLGPRPRGRPLRRRAWRPPTGESAWSWASRSAGRAGRSRGGWSPPAPAVALRPRPLPPRPTAVARIPLLWLLW